MKHYIDMSKFVDNNAFEVSDQSSTNDAHLYCSDPHT